MPPEAPPADRPPVLQEVDEERLGLCGVLFAKEGRFGENEVCAGLCRVRSDGLGGGLKGVDAVLETAKAVRQKLGMLFGGGGACDGGNAGKPQNGGERGGRLLVLADGGEVVEERPGEGQTEFGGRGGGARAAEFGEGGRFAGGRGNFGEESGDFGGGDGRVRRMGANLKPLPRLGAGCGIRGGGGPGGVGLLRGWVVCRGRRSGGQRDHQDEGRKEVPERMDLSMFDSVHGGFSFSWPAGRLTRNCLYLIMSQERCQQLSRIFPRRLMRGAGGRLPRRRAARRP